MEYMTFYQTVVGRTSTFGSQAGLFLRTGNIVVAATASKIFCLKAEYLAYLSLGEH